MAPRLTPRDMVGCDVFSGNLRIPAETCALRTLWQEEGYGESVPAYPQCANCLIGAARRAELEAGGWVGSQPAVIARAKSRRKAEIAARRRQRRVTLDPDETK